MDEERFITLLRSTTQPHTDMVKKATAALKKDFYPKPEALMALLQLATTHNDATLRQLASVQALGLIGKKWPSVPDGPKPQIRQHLLQSTFQEQDSRIRHGNCRLIAAIAKLDLADGQWAELPDTVAKAAVSSNPQEREVGTYILFTILEEMGDELMSRFQEFIKIYQKTIKDPQSAEVRINTMIGLSHMAVIVDADNDEANLAALQKLLPDMVAVLKEAIDNGNEEMVMKGFEVFQDLVESDSKLLNKNFRDLITFMAQIAGDTNQEKETRVQAQHLITSCVMFRKLKFQALRLGDQMVQQCLTLLTECADEDNEDEEDEETSLDLATLSLLAIMASHLPPSQVVGHLVPHFKKYAQSGEPARKRAAIAALGATVEGAPEFVDSQLSSIIPIVLQLLNDPDAKVREAATAGTKELCECCPETMAREHEKLIAALGKNLTAAVQYLGGEDDKSALSVVTNCLASFDSIFDGMKTEDLKRYMPDLVPAISQLLDHDDQKLRINAISAIGSLAEASEKEFMPYFKDCMNSLSQNIEIKDNEEQLELRSMTVDTMGSIAIAVGPEAFQPYVQPLLHSTEEGLHLDHGHLKETSYMFWGVLAKVYKTDFKPFLSGIVQGLFTALEQEEEGIELETGENDLVGQEVFVAGTKVKVVGEKDDDGDMEDDSDDDEWADIAGFSGIAEEKETALEALCEVIVNTKAEFGPYFEKSMEVVLGLSEHHNDSVRRAAFSTMFRAYSALFQLQPKAQQDYQPGLPVQVKPSSEIQKLGDVIMKATLNTWSSEDDTTVVIEINRNLAETLKLTGPTILTTDIMSQIAQTVTSFIQKKHPCQMFDRDEEESDDEESSEDDWYVIETALDTIGGLAFALGPQFAELWKILEKPILSYASATEAAQRSAAVGCTADCIKGMKNGVTPFTNQLMKSLLHRMSDEDPLTKSNAAYAIGMLVQNSEKTTETFKQYNTILSKLESLLQNPEMRQQDNAAGCVARMISKNKAGVPLDEVLPALVKLLPLKDDYEENEPVYSMIVKLYQEGDSTIQGLTPQLLPALNHVMGPPEEQLNDETRGQLVELAKYIQSKQSSALQGFTHLQAAAGS